jgi:nucleoside-diphosphate-sugar epimerase
MVTTTLLPTLVRRARCGEPIVLRGPRSYRQNFVHVVDVASLALTLAANIHGKTEPVINTFSDDTYGLFELAELIRTGIDSSSPTIDETQDTGYPAPVFENRLAKRHHPRFRTLRDHLKDLPS